MVIVWRATLMGKLGMAIGLLVLAGILADIAVGDSAEADGKLLKEAQSLFQPLPKDLATKELPLAPELVSLGRKLFFDPRISADGTVSCSRCHLATLYATDGLAKSHGAFDKPLPRNAPTILNAALQIKQHWRGELESVEEQATKSLLGPAFANPDFATAMGRIKRIPGYTELFQKAFPGVADPVTEDRWGRAIAAFERTLVTPSRFDDYVAGKKGALTPMEQRGLKVFMATGCAECHDGVGVGGGKLRKFGETGNYWTATHSRDVDHGRQDVTKDKQDEYVFKVPVLRNVEMTPPYFHDGSVRELPEAVRVMAQVQLGTKLSDEDTAAVVAFLKSLTGSVPADFLTAPILPPGGFDPETALGK